MKRGEVLQTAETLISGDRQASYGDAAESHQRIADLWAVYLNVEISAVDVAAMMVLLKVSRSKGSARDDNWIDICGYAALAGEMQGDALNTDFLRGYLKLALQAFRHRIGLR